MFGAWRDYQLPHVRLIWFCVYFAIAGAALALGAGGASALIAALVGLALLSALEFWYRRSHHE